MSKTLIARGLISTLLLSAVVGCSTIKSWFPDKERDYQFTTEIPELIVPDDLKNKGLATLPPQPAAPTDSVPVADASEASASVADATSSVTAPAIANESPAVTTVPSTSQGVSSLHIDQAKTPATRLVGKALSRQKVEVVERNIDKGYFYVKYDPEAVQAKDESIWDELDFMFGADPSNEQEYRVSVRSLSADSSEVIIADSEGQPLANAAANALLKLITDGINQELYQETAQPAPKAETGEEAAPQTTEPTGKQE